MNQARTMAQTAATATDTVNSFCSEAAAAFDALMAAAAPTAAEALLFPVFELSVLGTGATWTASESRRGYFRMAVAAVAAQSLDMRTDASFAKNVQASCTACSASTCLPFKEGNMMLERTGMAPLLMRIDARREETAADGV